jgi:hypothetical protein
VSWLLVTRDSDYQREFEGFDELRREAARLLGVTTETLAGWECALESGHAGFLYASWEELYADEDFGILFGERFPRAPT